MSVQNRQEAGYSILLELNGEEIPYQNVDGLVIRESIFSVLPRLNMSIRDVGWFSSSRPIKTKDKINVSIVSNAGKSGDVHYPFRVMKVENQNVDPNMPNNAALSVDCLLDFPGLFGGIESVVFDEKFSDVVTDVAKLVGMEPKINITSNDKMKWTCFGEDYMKFLLKSLNHVHISEKECPVLYGTKTGELVFDGLKRASESTSRISLVFDPTATVTPTDYDNKDFIKKGQAESRINVPYSNWSALDIKDYMNMFAGGNGIRLSYFDGEPVEKDYKPKDSEGVTERMVYGVKTLNVHKNYYSAMVNNRLNKNSFFGTCITMNTGLFGFKPMDRVHVTIPAGNQGDTSKELSGEYLIFQVLTVFNRDAKGEMVSMAKVG